MKARCPGYRNALLSFVPLFLISVGILIADDPAPCDVSRWLWTRTLETALLWRHLALIQFEETQNIVYLLTASREITALTPNKGYKSSSENSSFHTQADSGYYVQWGFNTNHLEFTIVANLLNDFLFVEVKLTKHCEAEIPLLCSGLVFQSAVRVMVLPSLFQKSSRSLST